YKREQIIVVTILLLDIKQNGIDLNNKGKMEIFPLLFPTNPKTYHLSVYSLSRQAILNFLRVALHFQRQLKASSWLHRAFLKLYLDALEFAAYRSKIRRTYHKARLPPVLFLRHFDSDVLVSTWKQLYAMSPTMLKGSQSQLVYPKHPKIILAYASPQHSMRILLA